MTTFFELPAGVVLAGGKSTRMGQDKALLRLSGTTLLERSVAVLAQVTDEVLVVADRADRFGRFDGARVVSDEFAGIGPLGGIHAGLKATKREAAFVVACDMPLLAPAVIAKQIALWRAGEADALVPLVDGRPEPLHAIYAKGCLPAIKRQIQAGQYRVRSLFEAVRVRFWEPGPEEARCLANVNTPEEWLELVRGRKRC